MDDFEKTQLFDQIIEAGAGDNGEFAGLGSSKDFYEGMHEGLYNFMKSIGLEEEFFEYCWDIQDMKPDVWKRYND